MEEKYNAIVIRSTNYKENDKMLNLFTLENGLVSACLRGAKKANSKLGWAGELFCFGEYVLIEKDGRRTVKEVNQIDSFYSIRLDADKLYASSAIAQFVSSFLLDGIKSYKLFLLVVNALKTLSQTNVDPKLILICFYLKGMEFQGYGLNFSKCCNCGEQIENRVFFSFSNGSAYCVNCADQFATEIRFSTYSLLNKCARISDDFSGVDWESFNEDESVFINGLRLLDFALKQNCDVTIKSHKFFIE